MFIGKALFHGKFLDGDRCFRVGAFSDDFGVVRDFCVFFEWFWWTFR